MTNSESEALDLEMSQPIKLPKLPSVRWGRPVARHGTTVYTSKDGGVYTITKRSYVLPSASVGYTVRRHGKKLYELDSLAEAKAAVNDDFLERSGYDIVCV